jgi:hypothetical protein
MDRVGVDDPEQEANIIRVEQTDVSLNPAAVQVMAATATQLQSLGYQNAQQAQQAMGAGAPGAGGASPEEQAMMAQGGNMNDLRSQMGAAGGVPGSGETPVPAQEALPGNVEGGAPGAAAGGQGVLAQTMIKGGEASNRLMFEQQLGGGPPSGG